MAGNQTDNLMLLDLTSGLPRTPETGGTPDTIQLSTDVQLITGANMVIDGNLTVNGTTTTIHSEQVNIRDNHLYLNADYTAVLAQTGGLVINVLPTATATTVAAGGFTAGVAAVSNPTVITAAAGTFAAGDVIQIAGANDQDNDGIFEVLSHVGTTLTIRGIGVTGATVSWVTNNFTTDATAGGDIRIVTVNVLEGNSSGNWNTATVTTTTGITYNTFTMQGVVDLQEAYEQGNTITTSAGEGNVVITGTELLLITATGGLDLNTVFDFDGTSFDVQMTGANGFSIDGTASSNVSVTSGSLTLSTATTGSVLVDGVDGVELNSTAGALQIGNDANAFAINIGTGAAARTITMGNATGATSVNFDAGTGAYTFDSTVPQTTALMTWSTTGAGGDSVQMFVGDSDPSGSVTGLAGSLFFRDTGSGAELYLNTSTGSGTAWTALSTAAGATLQTAYVAGNTITTSAAEGDVTFTGTEDFVVTLSDMLVDTTASISLDADTASNFTVAGADLTISTTTSGELDLTSAGLMDVNAGANLDIDVTGTYDVLSTGVFSIDGTGASNVTATSGDLSLSTATSGEVLVDGVSGVEINSSGGAIDIGNDANAFAINIGTGAAARTITMGNATGATSVNFDSGTGAYTFDSTVGEATALMTLTTTGTGGDSVNFFVGDNDPSGTVTGLAGSLFMRDTGTGAELYLNTSTGSGTTWSALAAGSRLTLTAAVIIAVGDVVALNTAGNVILADSDTGTDTFAYVIGVAATAAAAASPVQIFTTGPAPVTFSVAPGAATNGSIVFASATPGRGTLTAPTGMGNVVYKIGILQGADGVDLTPVVLLQPQFLAKRP
jgi:hypothetical protein